MAHKRTPILSNIFIAIFKALDTCGMKEDRRKVTWLPFIILKGANAITFYKTIAYVGDGILAYEDMSIEDRRSFVNLLCSKKLEVVRRNGNEYFIREVGADIISEMWSDIIREKDGLPEYSPLEVMSKPFEVIID